MLSILIKTYNEEAKIAATLDAALAALAEVDGETELIVADSRSTDRTVAIAAAYPGVRIVQLSEPAHRGCGAGVQLGFQFALGEFVYLLDGDMQLQPGYLPQAMAALHADPGLGGVAGYLEDTTFHSQIDQIRARNKLSATEGDVPHLNGGGLYRRTAIVAAGGYAGDRNLKAYEEADLGMRLKAAGYRLRRIPVPAVRHTGHAVGTLTLLARHWRSGRAMAAGVLLRGAVGQPWFVDALLSQRFAIAVLGIWGGGTLGALLLGSPVPLLTATGLLLALASVLALRKRSVVHAAISLSHWHYAALAVLIGLAYARVAPVLPLPATELTRS
ncbi:glycosyltransferase family 2 protein [Jeongeupia chitinilytica]|nr:glycosyltransferase [Jeongeupia chitinilytica]